MDSPSLQPPHTTLPPSYIWPQEYRPLSLHDSTQFPPPDIPVVDLQGWEAIAISETPSIVRELAAACEKWGVFYVVNHGVAVPIVERARDRGFRLFSLPSDTKMRARRGEGSLAGFGKADIGKFFDSEMWSEGFTMLGYPNSCIAELMSKLFPDGDHDEFRAAFEEYDAALRKLATELLRAILVGIGIDMNCFETNLFHLHDFRGALQMNHYPPCPEPAMTLGLPPHTDSSCITILSQGGVEGLEIYKEGRWITVPALRGSLIVGTGEMLQIISNGKYKSFLHRAVANRSKARLSVAYLCAPPPTATIAPACELVDSHNPPLYKPLTWAQYRQMKSKYFMGALEQFAYT